MAMTGMMRIDDRKGNSMIFIGITGGVGAGKSAVLGYLKELDGVRVMLSDEIAHELMEPGSDCYNRLKELFAGEPIWLEDGHFDRVALPVDMPLLLRALAVVWFISSAIRTKASFE